MQHQRHHAHVHHKAVELKGAEGRVAIDVGHARQRRRSLRLHIPRLLLQRSKLCRQRQLQRLKQLSVAGSDALRRGKTVKEYIGDAEVHLHFLGKGQGDLIDHNVYLGSGSALHIRHGAAAG